MTGVKKFFHHLFVNVSIGKRLMIFNFLVVLLPTAIILLLFYSQFCSIVQGGVLDSQVVTSLQAANNIDSVAQKLLDVCGTISGDSKLLDLLSAEEQDLTGGGARQDQLATKLETFLAVAGSHVDGTSVSAIRIYSDAPAELLNVNGEVLFADISHVKNTYWYGIFSSTNMSTLFAPEYYLSERERAGLGNVAVIRRQEFDHDGEIIVAYVAVYTHSNILVGPLTGIETASVEGIISYIINSRDTVVAQTDETAYDAYAMSYEDIPQITGEGIFVQKEVAGTRVFMTYRDINGTDWRMTWIVPYDSILAQGNIIIFQFVVIYLIMAALVFVIGILLSRTIVGRINSLRDQMKQIKTERPKPLSLQSGKDEVGELIETYNYMVGRINTLLDDTIAAAEELNSAKIKALRAQIDPHFLYNTLDMINWQAKKGNVEGASEAIVALSKFYRLTLNRGNLTASVSAELEHVSLYVTLMNMRFNNRIDYLVDVPEDMMDYKIPLIIFQPIVENAIQHGIFEKPSQHGTIIITGWIEKDTLCFLISDDGIGMTAEQISSLLLAKNETRSGSGIGAYNTHRRLQLMYNSEDCGLFYSSEYGKGTNVTFRIPKSLDKEGEDEV
jgi:two-component system sensor histidine kinase YesM